VSDETHKSTLFARAFGTKINQIPFSHVSVAVVFQKAKNFCSFFSPFFWTTREKEKISALSLFFVFTQTHTLQ